MQTLTQIILAHIESLGFATSVHVVNDMTEMHAVLKSNPDVQHIARITDGVTDDDQYRCAVLLAEMVGIELKGG